MGKNPDDVPWRGFCTKCRSEVEADRRELQVEHDQREDGEFGRASCPVCNYLMIFYPVKHE